MKTTCSKCNTIYEEEVLKERNLESCPVCGQSFSDNVVCQNCKTTFKKEVIEQREDSGVCPVCGERLDGEGELETWYFYASGGGTLDQMLFEFDTPTYTFKAKNVDDAERQLRKLVPSWGLPSPQLSCPICGSKQIEIVKRGPSLFRGFIGANQLERVCLRCRHKF